MMQRETVELNMGLQDTRVYYFPIRIMEIFRNQMWQSVRDACSVTL